MEHMDDEGYERGGEERETLLIQGLWGAADFIGISRGTLRRWMRDGTIPPHTFKRVGSPIYFNRRALEKWADEFTQGGAMSRLS